MGFFSKKAKDPFEGVKFQPVDKAAEARRKREEEQWVTCENGACRRRVQLKNTGQGLCSSCL